jgi:hypothetical protein
LELTVTGEAQAEIEVLLRRRTDLEPVSQPHVYILLSGKNLIPLASYPGWALAGHVKSFCASCDNLTASQTVHWHNIKFLKLRREVSVESGFSWSRIDMLFWGPAHRALLSPIACVWQMKIPLSFWRKKLK